MEKYIGVKLISAEPKLKEWINLENKTSGSDEGYKVVYEDGYTSWSPKEVFEKSYIKVSELLIIKKIGKTYAEHQERVIAELDDLIDKVEALRKFLLIDFFKTLAVEEQERLKNQELVMTAYALILKERIINF